MDDPREALWPRGVGMTDRAGDPDECSCPTRAFWCPCTQYLCGAPMWFTDMRDSDPHRGAQATLKTGWCCGWRMENADVLGTRLTFEARQCGGGVKGCCEPDLVVSDADSERVIGRTVLKCGVCECCCSDRVLLEAVDAAGNARFQRIESCCCPSVRYWSGNPCGKMQRNLPVYDAGRGMGGGAVAHITHEYHCCGFCKPTWTGIERMPPGLTKDDQMLLLSMALAHWWRQERDKIMEDPVDAAASTKA